MPNPDLISFLLGVAAVVALLGIVVLPLVLIRKRRGIPQWKGKH